MNRLSRAFSKSSRTKDKEAMAEVNSVERSPSPPPPSYREKEQEVHANHTDITTGFSKLQLQSSSSSSANQNVPSPQECIAHLKLLECFYRLKQNVAQTEGLFGISSNLASGYGHVEDNKNEIPALIAEKRWQVYVARAVSRFEAWRNALEPSYSYYTITEALYKGTRTLSDRVMPANANPFNFTVDNLPPLDVLMVWHAYVLNPRCYLEDCAREGRMRLWHTPMPWQAIADSVNNETFDYQPPKAAKMQFEDLTRGQWNNVDNPAGLHIDCPHCDTPNEVLWTTSGDALGQEYRRPSKGRDLSPGAVVASIKDRLSSCNGFADKDFSLICGHCEKQTTHDTLCAAKFRKDVQKALDEDIILPGTLLGKDGIPDKVGSISDSTGSDMYSFPNKLIKAGVGKQILVFNQDQEMTMNAVRDTLEEGLANKPLVKRARQSAAWQLLKLEAVAIRVMMSRYWENSSPFALDLAGAVIRQGSFIEKMHNIDWLHSPALPNTMSRLLVKYTRFISIISKEGRMAVPTLDVDLAWHTHQLNPSSYLQFTVSESKTLIDHDDKVTENKLNDYFAWTSKIYQKQYGEAYSECTCWYCEAIRESHTSTTSRIFKSGSATKDLPVTPTPYNAVHISSHNAVKPDNKHYDMQANKRAQELEKHYLKACERAEKKGRPKPKKDDYYYSSAWGFPVYMPLCAPYSNACGITSGIYPVDPNGVAVGVGDFGNCVAGSCGGSVERGFESYGTVGMGATSIAGYGFMGVGMGGGLVGMGSVGGGCGGGGGGGGGGCGGGGGGGC